MTSIAILSGGLATRLHPITHKTPKALIQIAGKPFLFWQLQLLKQQGFEHVIICVGFLGKQIQNIVGDGDRFGLQIEYSFDGETLLGTGGALQKALPLLPDHFFVMYGDSYLPIDYPAVWRAFLKAGKSGLMTVIRNKNQWDKSNAHLLSDGTVFYDKRHASDKMEFIDYGLLVLRSSVFKEVAGQGNRPMDLADVLHQLSKGGGMAGFEVKERFYEIGSRQGIEETERYLFKEE